MSSRHEQLAELIKSSKATGFTARFSGKEFLTATNYFFNSNLPGQYWVGGADAEGDNYVFFFVPSSLEGDGPHTVGHPPGTLPWIVRTNQLWEGTDRSWVKVNFYDKRERIKGTFFIELITGERVEGEFNISRAHK